MGAGQAERACSQWWAAPWVLAPRPPGSHCALAESGRGVTTPMGHPIARRPSPGTWTKAGQDSELVESGAFGLFGVPPPSWPRERLA